MGALLLAACGPGKVPNDATDGGSSGPPGSSSEGHASVGGESGTTASTGSLPATTAATTAVVTTSDGATSDDSSTGPPPVCREWHPHTGCPLDFPTATNVHGEGKLASISPVTAIYFGVFGWACQPGNAIHEFRAREPDGSMLYFGPDSPDTCGPEGWIGVHPVVGFQNPIPGAQDVSATLTIDGFAGDWDSEEPVDPPRILGHLTGDLVGPVEAIRCDLIDTYVDNCA